MNEDLLLSKMEKVLMADKILHEQQLGLYWCDHSLRGPLSLPRSVLPCNALWTHCRTTLRKRKRKLSGKAGQGGAGWRLLTA